MLLGAGAASGFARYTPPHQVIHFSVATMVFLMVPLILFIHIKRFYNKGAYDWVAWMHFVLFAFLLYIGVKMMRHWWWRSQNHHAHDDAG